MQLDNDKIKIIFLGTNGWYDTKTGNTVCTFLETRDYFIIFDAGNGFYKIDKYIVSKKPIYLFLSHFHLEHIIGLHILPKFNFSQGIQIYGQKGTKNILNKIIKQPYTMPIKSLPFKVEIYEIGEGIHKIPFLVKCKFLTHISPCLGYRIKLDGKTIAYCTDTGICENLKELAEGADLFITECGLRKSSENIEGWPHLGPEDSAKIAEEAKVKRLALTHFVADKYQNLEEREGAEKEARKIFKNTTVAFDDLQIKT